MNKNKMNVVPPITFPFEKDELEFLTKHHSLFIEEIPEEQNNLEDDKGRPISGVFTTNPGHNFFKFFVGDFETDCAELHPIMNRLIKAEPDDVLELHIDSSGGNITEGKLFYNIINNIFYKENVAAFLNTGYSMGAILFCMSEIRICHEFSDLMFHDYSGFNYGKAGDMETSLKHNTKHFRNFFRALTLDKGFLTEVEFEQLLIGKEFWMDTKEMCERGICTHVNTENGIIEAEKYLKNLKPKPKTKVSRKTKPPATPATETETLVSPAKS